MFNGYVILDIAKEIPVSELADFILSTQESKVFSITNEFFKYVDELNDFWSLEISTIN